MDTLQQAFAQLQSNKELAQRFVADPKDVLQELGVDTSHLNIEQIPANSAPFENFARNKELTTQAAPNVAVCGSLGFLGACVSVGS